MQDSDACPLVLPSTASKRSFEGYITCGDEDYRLSIIIPENGHLSEARLDCEWRLWHLMQGWEGTLQKWLEQSKNTASFLVELRSLLDRTQHAHPRFRPPLPPAFYSQLISDIDALGWDRVVHVDPSFMDIKIRARDCSAREHVLSIHLSPQHPSMPPLCHADIPVPFQPKWSTQEGLKDVLLQFEAELHRFEPLWDQLDDLDGRTWVLEPEHPSQACMHRRVVISQHVSLYLQLSPLHPMAPPECSLMGPDHAVQPLRERLNSKLGEWDTQAAVVENLERILELPLPSPSSSSREEFSVECGICYAHRLEGVAPEVVCDNAHCSQPFHHSCLLEWLKALPDSRQSFSTIFGECPYCSHAISLKVK